MSRSVEPAQPQAKSGPPDAAWARSLAEARAGRLSALGQLLESYRRYLLLAANQQLDDELRAKGGASDLVQETLTEAVGCFQRFDGDSEEQLRAWLAGILRHRANDFRRRYQRRSRQADREWPVADGSSAAGRELIDPHLTPQALAVRHDEALLLESALERLSLSHQCVLRLRGSQDLSFVEIGSVLNISADAARKTWARAVRCLRIELEQRNGCSRE